MVDQLASGSGGGGSLPAPASVATSNATASSMTIGWAAVTGAAGYNVYRNGSKVNGAAVTATSYVDTGLAPGTTYTGPWPPSTPTAGRVHCRLTGHRHHDRAEPCDCTTASNYAHVAAGRALSGGGYAWANGSNQNMGLWNVFVTTTLKMTGTELLRDRDLSLTLPGQSATHRSG